MTRILASHDAYARTTAATVERLVAGEDSETAVVLDQTVFYPGGGGQPADLGWLVVGPHERHAVHAVRKEGGDLLHDLGVLDLPPPAVGSSVTAELDWPRRHLLMRTHSALHALCGVVWRDYGAQVTGGNMEPGRGRMDFEFESLTADLVGTIEAAVNVELARERDISVRFLPRDEAFAIPDLIRTKVNLLPPGIPEVRVVDIQGLDLQADGGTHVANTREVGRIRVTDYESKGRINKRIRIELVDAPG